MKKKPNLLVILIDDLRYDEFGAGGHPYMKTPHVDRIAREGALFERAFHTTPSCSPNRASIVTGQYASRHGIIDNVARDAASHRLPNYHLDPQRLGYETAHIGKWHMGNSGMPRRVTATGSPSTVPNMLSAAEVVRSKPAWREAFELKKSDASRAVLDALYAGEQEEIRLRAQMMASVDEGVGMLFAVKAGLRVKDLVICQDIAATLLELAGGRPGPQIQGRSLLPLFAGKRAGWRKSFLVEYWAENAMPWLVGMTYKAVRPDRYKYIHWVNRGRERELDELDDLDRDPFELQNLNRSKAHAAVRAKLQRELARLVARGLGL
jgi:arylsulfatase A-like enzyme